MYVCMYVCMYADIICRTVFARYICTSQIHHSSMHVSPKIACVKTESAIETHLTKVEKFLQLQEMELLTQKLVTEAQKGQCKAMPLITFQGM